MRDVSLEVYFSDWAPAGKINFPRTLKLVRDGLTLFEESVSDVQVNPTFAADTLQFPGGAMPLLDQQLFDRGELSHQRYFLLDSLGLPFSGVDLAITPREIEPGVVCRRLHRIAADARDPDGESAHRGRSRRRDARLLAAAGAAARSRSCGRKGRAGRACPRRAGSTARAAKRLTGKRCGRSSPASLERADP
jgi:hypothetical protein